MAGHATLPPATVLAERYAVERELGRGGMATVYLARDLKHGRQVALKVLHRELASALGSERFLREIRIAARLAHPHILPLHDSGEADGRLYYVMPYVEGETLRERLKREERLAAEEAVRIAREVASALDYAHRQGVVHRDIKPENILLADGQAVVADFGIAWAVANREAADGGPLTETGVSLGTPTYMSPEQVGSQAQVDGRADLYSLGCVLYEMLAGRPPFQGRTALEVIVQHLADPPRALGELTAGATPALEGVVARALAKSPDDRFATGAELAAALDRAMAAGAGVAAPPAAASTIAILSFTNISGDPSVDWLGGGIAETLTADLKKIARVKVVDRARLMRTLAARPAPLSTDQDAAELGRTVGARLVVWGSFQTFGSRIRITPRFTDARTGELVGAEKIDGPMEQIFELQDRVVAGLMAALDLELSTTQLRGIARPETVALGAYEHYAKGRQLFEQFGRGAFDRAEQHFRQAIAADPGYALAHAGLGSVYAFRYIARARREDLDEAIVHLERATALDPDLAEPHQWLSYAYARAHRFEEATRAGARSTALAPDSTIAYYFAGVAHHVWAADERRWGGYVEAVPLYARSIELEPEHQTPYLNLSLVYANGGRYDLARPLADVAMRIEESGASRAIKFVGAPVVRASLHRREDELEAAVPLLERALERYPKSDHVYAENFTALAWCELGEIARRRNANDEALGHFGRAVRICERHPEKLGIGYYLVRARLGLAEAFHELGMRRDAERERAAAARLWETREGYIFSWVWTGSEGEGWFDFASYYAAVGRREDAVAMLSKAADAGWGDVQALRTDAGFRRLRGDAAVASLCETAARRAPLPPYPPELVRLSTATPTA